MNKIFTKVNEISLSDRVTLYIASLLAIATLPTLFFRITQQNWMFVFIDSFVILTGVVISVSVIKSYRISLMQTILCLIVAGALLLTISLDNGDHLFWVFPGIFAFFFLLRPVVALLISLTVLLGIFPMLSEASESTKVIFYTSMIPTVAFVYYCARELRVQHSNLSLLATEDLLTKSGNRRLFDHDLQVSMHNFKRYKTDCSLILLDIDDFKQLNDNYGHSVGDKVLQHLSFLITQRLRRTDTLYRLGGDEFAVILNHGGANEALLVAQDLHKYLQANVDETIPTPTLSMGVSQLEAQETGEAWIARTDKSLYASKEAGRNKITAAPSVCTQDIEQES